MKLSNPERLQLLMLCDIYDKLEIKEFDTGFLRKVIYERNEWAISWQLPEVLGDDRDEDPPYVGEVCDILDMWEAVELSYGNLTPEGKQVCQDLLRHRYEPRFGGFDGNNEGEYLSAARCLVEDCDRFSHFKGRVVNSHMRTLPGALRMAHAFKQIRANIVSIAEMSPQQIADVVNARYIQE